MREPFKAKVYHRGVVLPAILLFHCKALFVKRDCWSYSPPLIQSWPIQEKIWESLWKLEIVISHLSPTGYRGTEWYCLLGCLPWGGNQREGFMRAHKIGGHLQWEDECKVYGCPCYFSGAFILSVQYSGGLPQGHIVLDIYELYSESLFYSPGNVLVIWYWYYQQMFGNCRYIVIIIHTFISITMVLYLFYYCYKTFV